MTDGFDIPDGAIRVELPAARQQRDHTCGAAAVLAVARYYGVGPDTEDAVAADMGMTPDGSDPAHLVRALARYGLGFTEHRGMSLDELRDYVGRGAPVIVMLQAWGDPPPASYADVWSEGHWVVVIGFDDGGIYLADPMLVDARGYLSYGDLLARWHDVEGSEHVHVDRYGLAVRGEPANRVVVMRAVAIP